MCKTRHGICKYVYVQADGPICSPESIILVFSQMDTTVENRHSQNNIRKESS